MSYGRLISLHDQYGSRKYLSQDERIRFEQEAFHCDPYTKNFCRLLLWTGARVSEIMNLKASDIDISNQAIIIRTLKQRRNDVFRQIPLERSLIKDLSHLFDLKGLCQTHSTNTIWPFCKRSGVICIGQIGPPVSV